MQSLHKLKTGIHAEKYHYTSKKHRTVILQINKAGTVLTWKYIENGNRQGSCAISSLMGILYGGLSLTFGAYKQEIIQKMRDKEDDHPFFAWECVSLPVEARTFDF